jgi:hypothetical protein
LEDLMSKKAALKEKTSVKEGEPAPAPPAPIENKEAPKSQGGEAPAVPTPPVESQTPSEGPQVVAATVPPSTPAPKQSNDATADLVADIVGSKPTAEPEAVVQAAALKRRGRPVGSKTDANKSGIVTPKKKVPSWPDGTPIDFDACEIAAEQTTHSSLLVLATIAGDASIIKGQTHEAKEQEKVLVQGWQRHYEKFGIKEADPRWAIFTAYLGLAAVHMQKPKTRKKVIKRVKGFWGQAKVGWEALKEKIRAFREG